jgi:lycopene cyclase domain-containing protein
MTHLSYLGVLSFVLGGTLWLEFVVRTRVFRRLRRLMLSVVPVAAAFVLWDLYAISRGQWTFDPERVTGVELVGDLPLEELLFFLVIPLAAVLTLEAVRSVRGWTVGDELPSPADSHRSAR